MNDQQLARWKSYEHFVNRREKDHRLKFSADLILAMASAGVNSSYYKEYMKLYDEERKNYG